MALPNPEAQNPNPIPNPNPNPNPTEPEPEPEPETCPDPDQASGVEAIASAEPLDWEACVAADYVPPERYHSDTNTISNPSSNPTSMSHPRGTGPRSQPLARSPKPEPEPEPEPL